MASEIDTIGLTDLLIREPSLNGSGLRIAQVEASTSTTVERYQPSPAAASQPAAKFSFFDSNSVYPIAGAYASNKRSGHADTVADHYFDLNTGVATDVNEIYVFNANNFINDVLAPQLNINARVINQSFILTNINTTVDQLYDNYADSHQTLFVNGLNNGTNTSITSPATSYNSIAVGREDLNHSKGSTNNRSKPELIAPGFYTSFATPYVSGSAAVLIEAALTPLEHGGTGTASSASDIRTIKALLLNGAVKDFSWGHTDTRPLDTRRGAGLLNINQSHLQLQGGKHSPTASESFTASPTYPPSSSVSGNVSSLIGWNFSSIANPNGLPKDQVDNYYFDIPVGSSPLYDATATLVWHRQTAQTDINNLDLILYNANTGAVIEQSISNVDNIEHIYTRSLPAGRYVLQVIKRDTGRVTRTEDYALAFNFSIPAPDAPSALTATAQPYSEIDLTWTDNSTDELNFELQRSTLSGRAFNTIATLPSDTTSYTDTALLENTTYFYRVKATNSNGDSFYTNVDSATTFSKLMNWRQDNFTSSDDIGDSANSADPDKDGMNNLTEYALGTDPNSAAGNDGGSALPKASIINNGGTNYLQITITRATNKTDLNYTVEVGNNLLTWLPTTNILENTATTLRVRDNIAVSGNNRRFIRLKVTEK